MTQPALSVMCFNYNHGRFLRKCFAGLLAQTFADFEIVITDDGSTDDSAEIIREYAAKDRRVKPNYFPHNRGISAAFQDTIARSRGRYLYGAGADDFVISKDFFQRAVAVLDNDPRPAGFYGITGIYLSEKDQLLYSCGTAEVLGYNTPLQCAEGFLKCRSVITSPSCIWRRHLYMKHGGADILELLAHLGSLQDFYQNHLLAFLYGIHYEKVPFACQRIYEAKSNYSAIVDLWKVADGYAKLERMLRSVCPSYPGIEKDWLRWRAFWLQDSINKSGHLNNA
jgi:glycosyltransferase involved in cell wall biosynthesis